MQNGLSQETTIVYQYKNVLEIPVGKKMVHDFSGHSSGKFPGATERLKR